MSYEIESLEPVKFGDSGIEEAPTLDVELRLRLANIKTVTDAGTIEILADAFPEHREEVKRYMETKMNTLDLAKLQAYLVGGKALVEAITRKLSNGN